MHVSARYSCIGCMVSGFDSFTAICIGNVRYLLVKLIAKAKSGQLANRSEVSFHLLNLLLVLRRRRQGCS